MVAITGPRLSGKTTLAQKVTPGKRLFHTLDDPGTYRRAMSNPVEFIKGIEYGTIDEVQRVPELCRAIKLSVDSDPRPGRFLLTGSADIMAIPAIAESLGKRMTSLCLPPLSQAEIEGAQVSFLEDLFEDNSYPLKRVSHKIDDLAARVLRGGYPGMRSIVSAPAREKWVHDYVNGVLSLDIKELLGAYRLKDLMGLIHAGAKQSGKLAVHAVIARGLGIDIKTASAIFPRWSGCIFSNTCPLGPAGG